MSALVVNRATFGPWIESPDAEGTFGTGAVT